MRYLAVLILGLWSAMTQVQAQVWEDRHLFGSDTPLRSLRVISSTDTAYMAPAIEGFLRDNPQIGVEYLVAGSADINRIFRAAPDQYDVVISSAMDLQFKLANDGFAQRIGLPGHPDDAVWRDSLFAFTSEPAAIVLNRAAFDGHTLPQSRQDLITALRARPETFRNRIGTYDVRNSGLGYLFATQDARISETFWRLTEVMGALGTRLYCCSGDMIRDVADGKIAVAYNVLGSYAQARTDVADAIEIILPQDFPTTMMRTVFVSRQAPHPQEAEAFLRHLLAGFPKPDLPSLQTKQNNRAASRITLGPALLTYLDHLKKRRFVEAWENAILQDNAPSAPNHVE